MNFEPLEWNIAKIPKRNCFFESMNKTCCGFELFSSLFIEKNESKFLFMAFVQNGQTWRLLDVGRGVWCVKVVRLD